MIQESRVRPLNGKVASKGDYILYWMQQSQRAECNHALEYAVRLANQKRLPLVVGFGLTDDFPEANQRHYAFMLQGMAEVEKALRARGILMVARRGSPAKVALELGGKAAAVVCDRGYLRIQRAWRDQVARDASCGVFQVESDCVVPVETASYKAEYAARTIRPKIQRLWKEYLQGLKEMELENSSLPLTISGENLQDMEGLLKSLNLDQNVSRVSRFFTGGTSRAKERFRFFLEDSLGKYDRNSNQPQTDDISCMSPYLHFGQISPLYLALEAEKARKAAGKNVDAFLEELIIRRELAINFVHFTPDYDAYSCLPDWAKTTLAEHEKDQRDPIYRLKELENARTHDPYWNAAMKEMVHTGFMHNYMRMYWGKKILEWSPSPEEAFHRVLELNNRYFLDGRDPNSFAGVAWIFGKHDRAWKERPVFGKIRYMAASGLERKCDIQAYVEKIDKRNRNT